MKLLGTADELTAADAIRIAKHFLVLARVERCLEPAFLNSTPPTEADCLDIANAQAADSLTLPTSFASTLARRVFPSSTFKVSASPESLFGPAKETYVREGDERARHIEGKLKKVGMVIRLAAELEQRRREAEKGSTHEREYRRSQHCARIAAAAEWLFDAESESASAVAYVQTAIAFEALYGGKKGDPVDLTLANRVAYSLGDTIEEREELLTVFRKFYDKRSEIVHSGATRLASDEMGQFRWATRTLEEALQREISLLGPMPGEVLEATLWPPVGMAPTPL